MEQGLYAQLVIISRKYYDNKKVKEKTKKYNFQRKSAKSIRWFDLDHEWLEENVRTHESYYHGLFSIKNKLGTKRRKHIHYL